MRSAVIVLTVAFQAAVWVVATVAVLVLALAWAAGWHIGGFSDQPAVLKLAILAAFNAASDVAWLCVRAVTE